jgi:hypothetical protein
MHQDRADLINDLNVMMRLGLPVSPRQGGFRRQCPWLPIAGEI